MQSKNTYLERYAYPGQLIKKPPADDLQMIVVIPCYNEPDLLLSLQSLYDNIETWLSVEVIVVINDAENDDALIKSHNRKTCISASEWADKHQKKLLKFHIIYQGNLPNKHAGVGLARKIGMDESVKRFEEVGNDKGIIICFDADSLVEQNYLQSIERHFEKHPDSPGASIYFEHPLHGNLSNDHYNGIIHYELFLRYYVNALKYCGYPYAHHTVGSSMAVRSDAYQKQGGMNKRKAGEDFYFINKIIKLGKFTTIDETKVIPSSRSSTRVPFGTGSAIKKWIDQKEEKYMTYHPDIFVAIRLFLDQVDSFFKASQEKTNEIVNQLPKPVKEFLDSHGFMEVLQRINKHCGPTIENFRKQFYTWFDGLQILKFIHFAQREYAEDIELVKASQWLLNEFNSSKPTPGTVVELLIVFRNLDRKVINQNTL